MECFSHGQVYNRFLHSQNTPKSYDSMQWHALQLGNAVPGSFVLQLCTPYALGRGWGRQPITAVLCARFPGSQFPRCKGRPGEHDSLHDSWSLEIARNGWTLNPCQSKETGGIDECRDSCSNPRDSWAHIGYSLNWAYRGCSLAVPPALPTPPPFIVLGRLEHCGMVQDWGATPCPAL